VLVAAIAGAVLLMVWRQRRMAGVAAFLAGLLGLAITLYDRGHLIRLVPVPAEAGLIIITGSLQVGWGLYLALLASFSFARCGLVWLLALANSPESSGPGTATRRRVTALRALPRWRLAAAVLMLGVALPGAAVLYSHQEHYVRERLAAGLSANPRVPPSTIRRLERTLGRGLEARAWAGPTALAFILLGLAGAATLLVDARRLST